MRKLKMSSAGMLFQERLWFWRYLTRGVIWHLGQSSIRSQFSLLRVWNHARIRSWNQPVLCNKGKVSWTRTHDLHITSQTWSPLRHDALWIYIAHRLECFPFSFLFPLLDSFLVTNFWYLDVWHDHTWAIRQSKAFQVACETFQVFPAKLKGRICIHSSVKTPKRKWKQTSPFQSDYVSKFTNRRFEVKPLPSYQPFD